MDLAVKNFYESFITLPKNENNLSNEIFKYRFQAFRKKKTLQYSQKQDQPKGQEEQCNGIAKINKLQNKQWKKSQQYLKIKLPMRI